MIKALQMLVLALVWSLSLQAQVVGPDETTGRVTITNDDPQPASGCTSTFQDPNASIVRPPCLDIAIPQDANVPNKYYVDQAAGSGTTCSQQSPCASVATVGGKAGTSGGPAIIYVKGNGYLNLTASTLAGSLGNEIVIKPWPGETTRVLWTAAGGGQVGNANTIAGANTHHLIIDGGPLQLFEFRGSGFAGCQNAYTLVVRSNQVTLNRVAVNANGSCGPALGPGVGSGTHIVDFFFVNSELFGATQYYGVYTGGGTGCGAGDTSHTNLQFRNSIFRQIDGRGIQVEPRANSSGLIVDSSIFHDVGYSRSNNMTVSSAVQPAAACGGATTGVVVSNNLMYDLGGGGVLVDYNVGAAQFKIIHNTIWDYAKSSRTPNTSMHGIGVTSCSPSDCGTADTRNNIILQKNNSNVCAFDCSRSSGSNGQGLNANSNDNICGSGDGGCGSGSITGTVSGTFQSTSTASALFLSPQGPALAAALLQSGFVGDFYARTRSGAVDVGAIEVQ